MTTKTPQPTKPTATEALRAAGYVHANRGFNRAHDIYDAVTGDVVAQLHAREVWGWLAKKGGAR